MLDGSPLILAPSMETARRATRNLSHSLANGNPRARVRTSPVTARWYVLIEVTIFVFTWTVPDGTGERS
jgi:hypothetical protein